MENQDQREIVEQLNRAFVRLLDGLKVLVKSVPDDVLYKQPPMETVGESILRSAGVVEQTFGGLTANLWDDPFEWTLPETLASKDLVIEYLAEVDSTRAHAFSGFTDEALLKYVSVPSGEPCRILNLLLETLVRASEYHGRAIGTLKMLSGQGVQRFII